MVKIEHGGVRFIIELDEPPPTFRTNVKVRKGGGRYNDEKYTKYRDLIQSQVMSNTDKILIDGPVILDLNFSFPVPKQLSGVRRQYQKTANWVPHIVRPDIDNLAKLVIDSLEGMIYRNDTQINTLIVRKEYHETAKDMEGWFSNGKPDVNKWYVHVDCSGIGEWIERNEDDTTER